MKNLEVGHPWPTW